MKNTKKRTLFIAIAIATLLMATIAGIYAVSNTNTVSEKPVVEAPVATVEPVVTETPEVTPTEPVTTEPAVTEAPKPTETPVTESPVATTQPAETTKPVTPTEKPVVTEKPAATETPAAPTPKHTEEPVEPTPAPTEQPTTEVPAENTSGYLTVGEMSKYVIQSYLTNDTSTDYLHYAKLMISEGYFAEEDAAKYNDSADMSRLATRAELARVLTVYYVLSKGQDYFPENVVNTFSDLSKSDEVNYFYCNAAVHYGLMTSSSNEKFNPTGKITKDELFYGLTK